MNYNTILNDKNGLTKGKNNGDDNLLIPKLVNTSMDFRYAEEDEIRLAEGQLITVYSNIDKIPLLEMNPTKLAQIIFQENSEELTF